MNIDKVEIAREVLREMGITEEISEEYGLDYETWDISKETDEEHVINAMLVYLDRIEKLKIEDK